MPALVWASGPAGTLTLIKIGQEATSSPNSKSASALATTGVENQGLTFCPGVPVPFMAPMVMTFAAVPVSAGDHVIGTLSASGMVFESCIVNPLETGSCQISPDGSTISFDLPSILASEADLSGLMEIPPGGPSCGTITLTADLTAPQTYHLSQSTAYECNGVPCPIPLLSRTGLAILALLLAAVAAAVLSRRM
jgi:hypothetical protein